jgi:hypothetical protein
MILLVNFDFLDRRASLKEATYRMSEQEPLSAGNIALIPLLFAIIFPIFWCAVIWLISQISGWAALAQRYRAMQPASGKVWSWQYGMIGWAGYNGVLKLTANAEGLFMENIWLFSFGHPRLFIPWYEFREAKVESYFFRRQVRAKVGFPPVATVRLPTAPFEESEGHKVVTGM